MSSGRIVPRSQAERLTRRRKLKPLWSLSDREVGNWPEPALAVMQQFGC